MSKIELAKTLSRKQSFDILIDKGQTFPAYVNLEYTQVEVETINEAIQKYYSLLEKQERVQDNGGE